MNKEKLQKNLANVGTNIQYAGSSLGSSLKHKLTGHKEHDAESEMIDQCDHDLKQLIKGLQYLKKQVLRLAAKHWPDLFKMSLKTAKVLIVLLGEKSLTFKGIDEFYDRFDALQSSAESFVVHPKEKQFFVPSLQQELFNYLATMAQLLERFVTLGETHAKKVGAKVDPIVRHIKHVRHAIAARNKQRAKCDKLQWKTDKLAKKSLLSDKELREFEELERRLDFETGIYSNIHSRLKTVIPEFLALADEFVEKLTAWFICHQYQLYKEMNSALEYYATFYGLLAKSADEDDPSGLLAQSYNKIIEDWESQATPVRLQTESFLSVIYNKNPELLNEEITDKDKRLTINKAWTQVKEKATTKLHKVKAADRGTGIFNEYSEADPLVSFAKYNDPQQNKSETYHPSRVLTQEELYATPSETQTPPPLPPRDENHRINMALPMLFLTPLTTLSSVDLTLDSSDSLSSLELMSLHSDSDTESDTFSTEPTTEVKTAAERGSAVSERIIAEMYNAKKNDITRAPETHPDWPVSKATAIDEKSSVSYKLIQLTAFFDRAMRLAESQTDKRSVVATKDYEGVNPGDLSFKQGDKVEVVFDLQSLGVAYNPDGANWFVGSVGLRVGFAPNTHFLWD